MKFRKMFCAGLAVCAISYGAGFSILEQSATGMGRSLAGMTVEDSDPASLYYNPATVVGAERPELMLGNHVMHVRGWVKDKGSDAALGGDESNNLGGWVMIPNMYYVQPINKDFSFGVGLSATSGTATSYNPYWMGRYASIDTEIAVMDFNPVIAWKVREDLSIGVGIVLERAEVTMKQMVPLTSLRTGNPYDAKMVIEGDSIAYGFTAGVLYEPIKGTKIGLGYRSRMKHEADLDADLKGAKGYRSLGYNTSSDADLTLKLPRIINFGFEQAINDKLTAMMDISWSEWSVMDEMKVKFDRKILTSSGSTQEMKWNDNFRVSVGGDYKVTDKLEWRFGATFDETPTSDKYRNLKLPDANRYWISTGFGYRYNEHIRFDVGYTHIIMESVSFTEQTAGGTVRAKAKGNTNIYSFSMTYTF